IRNLLSIPFSPPTPTPPSHTLSLHDALPIYSKGVSYNPKEQALWFGLVPFRSPLLGKSHLLSLPPDNKMFQFPGSASFTLCIQINVLLHYEQWVPPFGNPCIRLLTTPQGLSELVPSFFGS